MRRGFARDQRGLAAVEFALIVPVLASVLLFGFDGWMQLRQAGDMQTALHSGVRYYQAGGTSDYDALVVGLNAWPHKPAGATFSVARACVCGGAAGSCNTLCGTQPPNIQVTLSASSTYAGSMYSRAMTETQVVRVR